MISLLIASEEALAQEQQYSSMETGSSWASEAQTLPEDEDQAEEPTVEEAPAEEVPAEEVPVFDEGSVEQYDPGSTGGPAPRPEPAPEAPEPEPSPEPAPELPEPAPAPAPESPGEEQYGPGTGTVPAPAPGTPAEEQYEEAPAPAPVPEPPGQYDPGTATPPVPESPDEEQYEPGMGGAVPPGGTPPEAPPAAEVPPAEAPVPEPVPAPEPPTQPIALEGSEGGTAHTSHPAENSGPTPASAPVEDEPLLTWSSLKTVAHSVTETLADTVAGILEPLAGWSVPEPLTTEYWSQVGATLAGMLLGEQPAEGASHAELWSPETPSSPASQEPEPMPRSFPAGSPPAGASQVLSPGGTGSGVPFMLLLCTLVSAALLARRDGKLSWILFLVPRPHPFPRPALERPG